jgi:cation transport ATPase
MKLIRTIVAKTNESNEDFFKRKLRLALANYREAITRKPGEGWKEHSDRFKSFDVEYGLGYITDLRKNVTDTQKKLDKRKAIYQGHWETIVNSEAKKLADEYQRKMKDLKVSNKKALEDLKQSKTSDAYAKIEAKHNFEKDLQDKDKKEKENELEKVEQELYDKKIFKAFIMIIMIFFVCIFLKLWFIAHILGNISLVVFGATLIYLYNSDKIYQWFNENKWYRMVMSGIYQFSCITSKVLISAGHTTIRK